MVKSNLSASCVVPASFVSSALLPLTVAVAQQVK